MKKEITKKIQFLSENILYKNYIEYAEYELKSLWFKKCYSQVLNNNINIDKLIEIFDEKEREARIFFNDFNFLNIYYLNITNEMLIYRLFELLFYIDTIVQIHNTSKKMLLSFIFKEDFYNENFKLIKQLARITSLIIKSDRINDNNISIKSYVNDMNIANINIYNNHIHLIIDNNILFSIIKENLTLKRFNKFLLQYDYRFHFDIKSNINLNHITVAMNEKSKNIAFKLYCDNVIHNVNSSPKQGHILLDHIDYDYFKNQINNNDDIKLFLVYSKDNIDYIAVNSPIMKKNFTYKELSDIIYKHDFNMYYQRY